MVLVIVRSYILLCTDYKKIFIIVQLSIDLQLHIVLLCDIVSRFMICEPQLLTKCSELKMVGYRCELLILHG